MANTSAIDLSLLTAPTLVDPTDFDTAYAANLAIAQSLMPDFDATMDSDPVVKVLQAFAYREVLLRARVNDAARAVMVAYALDADLDQLGALMGVARLTITPADPTTGAAAVMETDDDFRRRIVLAPQGYSVAGPEGAYIFHALSASSDVRDASATAPQPDDIKALVIALLQERAVDAAVVTDMQTMLDNAVWPGTVEVTILSRTGDGTAPQATIDAVLAALSSDTVRPLTDFVTVKSTEAVPYSVDATLYFDDGPDRSVVLAAARDRLQTYITMSLLLGRDIVRAGHISALMPQGVQNVDLRSPAADQALSDQQSPNCISINLVDGGVAG
ncbi:baseplate assembly protein [Novosphingobium rosa]|uniref:baseplate assembly protein n=1 Tax=Novosphingobium rosa TaxID=76978 RepID=UPI00083645A7|nr:baseplate J/gp47 family protein [Novosphingobium rosa]